MNSKLHTGHEHGTNIILERFGEAKYNSVLSSKSASPPLSLQERVKVGGRNKELGQTLPMYRSRNTKAGRVQPDGRMWKDGGKIQTSRLIRCRLERTNARLQGKPINQSHSASNRALAETEQAIWNWSQQINTAAQLKASIMTIINPTSLHQPHQESAKLMRSC